MSWKEGFYFNNFDMAVISNKHGHRGILYENKSGRVPTVKDMHIKNEDGSITIQKYKVILESEETLSKELFIEVGKVEVNK